MKPHLYKIFKPFIRQISLDFPLHLSGKNQILPFYHTVSDQALPHFSELKFFRTQKRFLEDLDCFTKYYESVGIMEVGSNKKSFHLSFDDGMSEIFSVVYPILKEKNIHATFFINSDFINNERMFKSHKKSLIIHSVKNSKSLENSITSFLNKNFDESLTHIGQIKNEIEIDKLANLLKVDFNDYLQTYQPYLKISQLQELKNAGFTIANHGKSHTNFNTLNFGAQKEEIRSVNAFLKSELSIDNQFFCFPYGDLDIKNELFEWMYHEENILKSFGISGLKNDTFPNHFHRILMEYNEYSALEILKFEYFYYMMKFFANKNRIKR